MDLQASVMQPDRTSNTSTPRWVKVFGIIALVLVLVVGFVMLTGVGGPHRLWSPHTVRPDTALQRQQ